MTTRRSIIQRAADRHRERSLGQSMVEFALVFPVILLLLMVALDFGRIYLGWIKLQNMTRIGASFAATNATDFATNDSVTIDRYQTQVFNEATANGCKLLKADGTPTTSKSDVPPPTFSGYDL